jgi:hypothetical protein
VFAALSAAIVTFGVVNAAAIAGDAWFAGKPKAVAAAPAPAE